MKHPALGPCRLLTREDNTEVSVDELDTIAGDSGRYYPPNPEEQEVILYRLMQMLHPRPFLLTRFGPHGSAAIVQAVNSDYYKIGFR